MKIPRQVQLAEVGPRFEMKRDYKVFLQIPSQTLTPGSKRTRSGRVRSNKQRQSGNGSSRIILVRPKNVACSQDPTRHPLSLLRKKQGDSRPVLAHHVSNSYGFCLPWARYLQQGPSPSIQDIQTAPLDVRFRFAFLQTNDRDQVPGCGSGRFWYAASTVYLYLYFTNILASPVGTRYSINSQTLVQSGESFKERGKEVNRILYIMRTSSLSDRVHG